MKFDAHARRFVRWAVWPLALLTLWASIATFRFASAAIDYPFQLDPIESKLLQQALWIQDGEPIYFRLGPEPPWVVGNYPPLFPLLAAPFVDPTLPDFTALRVLTLLSTLAAGGALWFGVSRLTGSIALGLLSAGLWWSTWEVYHWTALARVDLPALAFAAWGFALGVTFRHWSWPRVLAVCALFWAAWMTRQTQVLLPLALIGGMWFADRRWALRLGIVWAGGIIALLALMMLWTRGAYGELVFLANINETVPGQLAIHLRHLWRFQPFGLLALLVGVVAMAIHLCGVRRLACAVECGGLPPQGETADDAGGGKPPQSTAAPRRRTPHGPPALVALILALLLNAVNILALAKVGADKNYLLEPQWCLAALLPVLLWHLATGAAERPRRLPVGIAAVVFALLLVGHVMFSLTARLPGAPWREGLLPDRSVWRSPPTAHHTARDLQILSALERADGPILTEYGIYELRLEGEITWEPFLATQLAAQDLWDETPLLQRVRAGEFAAILVEDDLAADGVRLSVTDAFAEAVRSRYALAREWPGTITQRLWVVR